MTFRHDTITRRRRLWRSPGVCIIYGNCQAEPLRRLLAASPTFAARFETHPIRAVQSIPRDGVADLQELLGRAALVLAQPVADGYRDLPLGTDQIATRLSRRARLVRIPNLHYRGLHPYTVYVPMARTQRAPGTVYHDLRLLWASARGWDAPRTLAWLAEFRPDPDGLREHAAESERELAYRERELDVRLAHRLRASDLHARGFWTIDHPSNALLGELAEQVHAVLGLDPPVPSAHSELLDEFQAPLEQPVIDALGLDASARPEWVVRGETLPAATIVEEHLAFYREHPELVGAAHEHLGHWMAELSLE